MIHRLLTVAAETIADVFSVHLRNVVSEEEQDGGMQRK